MNTRYIHQAVFVLSYPVSKYAAKVYHGIQLFPLEFVSKDDAPQLLAVQCTISEENLLSKSLPLF